MKNKIIVEKILKYICKIIDYTHGTEYNEFAENTILVEACVFNLSQIGELANKTDKEFEEEYAYSEQLVKIMENIYDIFGYSTVLSPIITSNSFFNEWKNDLPFYKNIASEGVRIVA